MLYFHQPFWQPTMNRIFRNSDLKKDFSCFLFVDSDCLRLAQLITVSSQDGGSKPEAVTLCTTVRQRLDLLIDSDCPRHVQFEPVKKSRWAITMEVTKTDHILVVYQPILKRSIVP